jgi:hypothetical protein
MRRFVVLVAMLVPLSLFAAGCGGEGGAGSSSGKKATEAQKKNMLPMQKAMMPQQGKDAGAPDKAPTPEK